MWSKLALLACVAVSSLVSAAPTEQLTNAQRMQRGLPLNAPTKRYNSTRTRALLPRASDTGTEQSVITFQTVPLAKRGSSYVTKYVSYDSTNNLLYLGTDVNSALILDLPTSGSLTDGQIVADTGNSQLFLESYAGDTTGTFKFGLTANSDGAAPAGKSEQTSIWTYYTSSGALFPEYFPSTGSAQTIHFGLDSNSNFIGALDTADLVQSLTPTVISYQEAVASISPVPQIMSITSVGTLLTLNPAQQYIQYSDSNGGAFLFVTDSADATVFYVAPSTTDPTKSVITFEYQGATKIFALKYGVQAYCGQCPATFYIVPTPGAYDTNTIPGPLETDVWSLTSGTMPGLSGTYTYSGGSTTDVYLTLGNPGLVGYTYTAAQYGYNGLNIQFVDAP